MDAVRGIAGLLCGAMLWAGVGQGQEVIRWQNDVEQARRSAADSNRLVLVHFVIRNCPPCAKLEANVFPDPRFVQAVQASFVPVKLNADDFPMTAEKFGVSRFPTDVVLTSGGTVIAQTGCPQTVDAYVTQLGQIADYHRRTIEQTAAVSARPSASPVSATSGVAATPNNQAFPPQVSPAQPTTGSGIGRGNDPYAASPPATTVPATTLARPNVSPPDDRLPYGRALQQSVAGPETVTGRPEPNRNVSTAGLQPPASNVPPQLGLDGFCPVQLAEGQRWVPGDRRFGATHRGRTYLFNSPQEQQKFLANPDRFSPMLSGYDPVVWHHAGRLIPGRREFGATYGERVFLFADEASYQEFYKHPDIYIGGVEQAMQAADRVRR